MRTLQVRLKPVTSAPKKASTPSASGDDRGALMDAIRGFGGANGLRKVQA